MGGAVNTIKTVGGLAAISLLVTGGTVTANIVSSRMRQEPGPSTAVKVGMLVGGAIGLVGTAAVLARNLDLAGAVVGTMLAGSAAAWSLAGVGAMAGGLFDAAVGAQRPRLV